MGCLRLGYSFLVSLLAAVIFTIVGALGGAILSLVLSHGSGSVASIVSPLDILTANSTGALIGAGAGALIGLYGVIRATKRASDINWLKRNGRCITAIVAEIQTKRESRQVPYTTANGTYYRTESSTYYVVVARWVNPQTRQTHTFHSERRTFYPKKYAPGSSISVLIDPQNPQRSFVEV
ncbi:hypothetical protein KSF_009760 [Reticulibacter mediterranei]|uniref:DUF3592 domain-containing protein n=1 Tax=Reticulibacter mediterranei TaxID=2778369 RepID=A0A8J3IE92_9CHLR|nr:hypothetical protein [Reticulibacter mediterranei]GHO90928.1 hypothetical protein KSF_009760 [Reticulibacter mediterranei]